MAGKDASCKPSAQIAQEEAQMMRVNLQANESWPQLECRDHDLRLLSAVLHLRLRSGFCVVVGQVQNSKR